MNSVFNETGAMKPAEINNPQDGGDLGAGSHWLDGLANDWNQFAHGHVSSSGLPSLEIINEVKNDLTGGVKELERRYKDIPQEDKDAVVRDFINLAGTPEARKLAIETITTIAAVARHRPDAAAVSGSALLGDGLKLIECPEGQQLAKDTAKVLYDMYKDHPEGVLSSEQ